MQQPLIQIPLRCRDLLMGLQDDDPGTAQSRRLSPSNAPTTGQCMENCKEYVVSAWLSSFKEVVL